MDAVPSFKELRQMAEMNALEAASMIRGGVESEEMLARAVASFKDTYQPLLVDKVFTALFKTYSQWFIAAVNNLLEPGSVEYKNPITVDSIHDGQEVARTNRLLLSPDLMHQYRSAVENLAKDCASKLVAASKSGEDSRELLMQYNYSAAQLDLDFGLTEQEAISQNDLFSLLLTKEVDQLLSPSA